MCWKSAARYRAQHRAPPIMMVHSTSPCKGYDGNAACTQDKSTCCGALHSCLLSGMLHVGIDIKLNELYNVLIHVLTLQLSQLLSAPCNQHL